MFRVSALLNLNAIPTALAMNALPSTFGSKTPLADAVKVAVEKRAVV